MSIGSSSGRAPRPLSIACAVALVASCAPAAELGEACGERPADSHRPSPYAPLAVDVLVVIDDTPATQPFVDGFADALPVFLRALRTGDHDADGVPETRAIESLHVGITTGDLGGGVVPLDGCIAGPGGNALLRPRGTDAACDRMLAGRFLALGPGDDAGELDALRCVARTSGTGCTISQPLEALLRAVSDDALHSWNRIGAEPPRFLDATGSDVLGGHACPPGGGCPHEG